MNTRIAVGLVSLCAVVTLAGCGGESFQTAELTGRVTLEGKPLAGVVVQFEPRNLNSKKLMPSAYGITDADGRYRAFRTGKKKFGAVVGVSQVRVTVPEGNAAKVHPLYAGDRAFWAEVTPGPNVFDLELIDDPTPNRRATGDKPPAE
jgi:hypothetical protein